MAISTNSIIHYTKSYEVLTTILKEGLKIKYCLEELSLNGGGSFAAHPMVSFCDIPLSDSKQHFATYGKYGIGLSKEWAIKNCINPVIYIDKNSHFALTINKLLKERRKSNTKLSENLKTEILRIKSYAKNYSETLHRNSIKTPDFRFYDEREWRLVPSDEILNGAPFSVSRKFYLKNKAKYNKKLSGIRIKFEPVDISYIIVENTKQIRQMTKFLRSRFLNKCTPNELDFLFSKICSIEQIINDY